MFAKDEKESGVFVVSGVNDVALVGMENPLTKSQKHRDSLIQFVSEITSEENGDTGKMIFPEETESIHVDLLIPDFITTQVLPADETPENATVLPLEEEEIVPENHALTENASTISFEDRFPVPSKMVEDDIIPQVQLTTRNIPSYEETLNGMVNKDEGNAKTNFEFEIRKDRRSDRGNHLFDNAFRFC